MKAEKYSESSLSIVPPIVNENPLLYNTTVEPSTLDDRRRSERPPTATTHNTGILWHLVKQNIFYENVAVKIGVK